jgi:hypothetical protein
MRIQGDVVKKHWREAAIEELVREYETKGYSTEVEVLVGDLTADIVARKGGEVVVIEVQPGQWSAGDSEAIKRLRNLAVRELGAEFRLVVATPPRDVDIEIAELEQILLDVFADELPSELATLSRRTVVDEVSDIEIDALKVARGGVEVSGSGVASVELNDGSDSDRRNDRVLTNHESFAFRFELRLSPELEVIESRIKVDTSSFAD